MARRSPTRVIRANTTVLIVGEGYADKAFLEHLKGLYISRNCGVSVTTRNAFGKGPENVLDAVIGQSRNKDFSYRAALLDTDLKWTPRMCSKARKERVHLIGSQPCLEGFLLHILRQPVPKSSEECKCRLHPVLGGNPTISASYAAAFGRAILEERRGSFPELDQLLRLLEGKKPVD